jgi:ribosomal protein S18 acetylase RimI-like enzyme
MRAELSGEVVLRDLDASDSGAVADIHAAAFPNAALTQLGREAVRRYYAWQLESGEKELYAFGAAIDGALAGFCFGGILPSAISGYLRRNCVFLIGRVLAHPKVIFNPLVRSRLETAVAIIVGRRRRAAATTQPRPRKLPFDILSIAVLPEFQGIGLGEAMMQAAESAARVNGFHYMTLGVNVGNARAVAFYERIGWSKALYWGGWRGNMIKWLDR